MAAGHRMCLAIVANKLYRCPMPVPILSNELRNADGRTRWFNYQYSSIMDPYGLPRASAGDNRPARFGASRERDTRVCSKLVTIVLLHLVPRDSTLCVVSAEVY
jgi:hypothetical protein